MRFHFITLPICRWATALGCLFLSPITAWAAVNTWTGMANDNWSMSGNWTTTNPGGVPVDGDSVVFTASTPNNSTDLDIGGLLLTDVTFDASAASYTLSGDGFNLGWKTVPPPMGTGITYTGDIVSNSSNTQTINTPITFDPAKHVISTASGRLNLHGPITQSKGSAVIFSDGGGGINVSGSGMTSSNGILGGWATIGTDWAALDGSGNVVPYAGYTTVNAGETILDNAAANIRVPVNGTPISITTPTTNINSLVFGDGTTASAAAQVVNVGLGNKIVLPQNGGFYNVTGANGNTIRSMTIGANLAEGGTLTAGDGIVPDATITFSSTPINVAPQGNGGAFTVNSAITDNGDTKVAVVVRGGYVTPAGGVTNTFSGGLYVVSGRWSQPNAGNIGTGPVYVFPGGMINPGATTPVNIANNLFIAGNGTTENNGLGAVRMFQNTDGNNTLLTGTVTLMADASVSSNGNTNPTRNVGITGKITGPGGLMIGSPTSNANANGSGVVVIGPLAGPAAAPNDYAGDTTINGTLGGAVGSILKITNPDADNIIPHGAAGSFAGGPTGNIVLNATSIERIAVFDLNGSTQTINGLTNTSTSPLDNYVESAVPGGHLILGDNNASAEFGGTLHDFNGTLAVTKIGSGTQTFSGPNNEYSGDTRVQGGTLRITNPFLHDMADIYVSNGASLDLNFAGTDTIDSLVLGGVPAAIGVWGSPASTAANKSPLLAGSGLLMVTTLGTVPMLTGDFNANGVVDAADYVLWRNGGPLANDPTMGVQPEDYNTWRANFGRSAAGSGAATQRSNVPEPSAFVLEILVIGSGILLRSRRV
jgi:fibronectin-binding autotransporter adhesin